jgi:hypothetical protein
MLMRARVMKGRLILDEPTQLPDGTELELVPIDEIPPPEGLPDSDRETQREQLTDMVARSLTRR